MRGTLSRIQLSLFSAFKTLSHRNMEWNKTVSIAVWNALKTVAIATWNGIKFAIQNPIQALKNTISFIWNAIKIGAVLAWTGIKLQLC